MRDHHTTFVWTAPKVILAGAVLLAAGGTGMALYPVVRDAILGNAQVQEGRRGDPCSQQTEERGIAIFCEDGARQPNLYTTDGAPAPTQPRPPSEPRGTLSDW